MPSLLFIAGAIMVIAIVLVIMRGGIGGQKEKAKYQYKRQNFFFVSRRAYVL